VAAERQDVEPEPDISPQQIGGFRVLRRLASGATTDVLLARAEGPHGFERVVALKVLLQPSRSDPAFESSFAREAAAYARLSHPAIVKLYDFFAVDGQLVMVLEYIDGLPLHKLRATLSIGGERLEDSAAFFIGSRIFAALAAAHSASNPTSGEFSPVIHRDINPSNVLVPWDGHEKVSDFGIGKASGAQGDMRMGFVKGTYGYMAPEQVRGEAVTVRADVYSATLILWELLTRRKAIQRGSLPEADVLKAMITPEFPPLDTLRPDVSADVREAVRLGLEVDPDRRAITAEEMANILKRAMIGDEGRGSLADAISRVRPTTPSGAVRVVPVAEVGASWVPPTSPATDSASAAPLPDSSVEASSTLAHDANSLLGDQDSTPIAPTVSGAPPLVEELAPELPASPLSSPAASENEAPVPEVSRPAPPVLGEEFSAMASPAAPLPVGSVVSSRQAVTVGPPRRSSSLLLVVGVALGLALIAVGGFRVFVRDDDSAPAPTPPSSEAAAPPSPPPSAKPPTPTSPSAGESVPASLTSVRPKPTESEDGSAPHRAATATAAESGGSGGTALEGGTSPLPSGSAPASRQVAGPGQGTLVTETVAGGHRIFVDGRVVGESPSSAVVSCGTHNVQVGSAGTARSVVVPCGGSVSVTP
jgi:serine/threonine protein kinase